MNTNGNPEFQLLTDKDLTNLPPQRWLVKNIIPEAGFGTVFGDSGTYKSFLGLDLMAHVARGEHWFGHRVKPSPCVYVPFEGRGGIPKRVEAWIKAQTHARSALRLFVDSNGKPQFSFYCGPEISTNIAFVMEPLNLRDKKDRDKLVLTLRNRGLAGGILCIDTLAQAGGGIDENSPEGMGEMIGIFQELQTQLGGVVLVVHHTGKNLARGMRGWSGLRGALDFAIECQKDDAQLCAKFRLDKVKDEAEGKEFLFSMKSIYLGDDEDGDPITSLVVAHERTETEPAALRTGTFRNAKQGTDAQQEADDESFIHYWIKREVADGKYPSKNSVEQQRGEMKRQREMTQTRIRGAMDRLRSKSLLADAPVKSPTNNKWIRAIDPTSAPSAK